VFTKIHAACLLIVAVALPDLADARERRPAPIEYASLGPTAEPAPTHEVSEDLGPGAAMLVEPNGAEAPFGVPLDAYATGLEPETPPPPAPDQAYAAALPPSVVGTGPYYVQLAAFGDVQNAERMRVRLNRDDALIVTSRTSKGIVHRVRLGGYATREEAELARDQMQDNGFSGALVIAER